jgi:hypothetical protein
MSLCACVVVAELARQMSVTANKATSVINSMQLELSADGSYAGWV